MTSICTGICTGIYIGSASPLTIAVRDNNMSQGIEDVQAGQ